MRHIRSILYALVLAPAVWVLCGVGFTGDLIGRLPLLLAGAAYAILIFAPISPAGPVLGGLAFLGIGLWALTAPSSYAGVWPANVSKNGFDLSQPGYGLALLLAVPMICTALSARRWAKYEPPVLPLIGPLGRARGAAPVAGIPISVTETAILTAPPTEVITLRAAEPKTEAVPTARVPLPDNGDEATTLLPTGRAMAAAGAEQDNEATTLLSAPPAVPDDEVTTLLSVPPAVPDDEVTTLLTVPVAERAAEKDDQVTTLLSTPLAVQDDEATTLLASTASSAASFAVSSDGATTTLLVVPVDGVPDEATVDEPTETVVAAQEDLTEAVITQAVVVDADDDETTAAALVFAGVDEDGEDKTQVLRLPSARDVTPAQNDEHPTEDVRGDEQTVGIEQPTADVHDAQPAESVRTADERPTDDFDLGLPMRDFGPGEKTQVIARNPGETTQVIRRTGAIYPPPGETTQSIQPPSGTVEPPSDRTQVIKLPTAPAPNDERNTPAPSIVGEERPDSAADATTRLIPVPGPDYTTIEQRSGESTARTPGAASTAERPMTVLNMERPSDEAEDDTRSLTVPNQRQPQAD